jgi:hypothetical protein
MHRVTILHLGHMRKGGVKRVRRAVHVSGLSIALRESRREFYIPCSTMSNNTEWERRWFYLQNDEPGLPPTPTRC